MERKYAAGMAISRQNIIMASATMSVCVEGITRALPICIRRRNRSAGAGFVDACTPGGNATGLMISSFGLHSEMGGASPTRSKPNTRRRLSFDFGQSRAMAQFGPLRTLRSGQVETALSKRAAV